MAVEKLPPSQADIPTNGQIRHLEAVSAPSGLPRDVRQQQNLRADEVAQDILQRIQDPEEATVALTITNLYHREGLSAKQVGVIMETDQYWVDRRMKKDGIPTRSREESQVIFWKDPKRVEAIVAKIHAGDSDARRSASLEKSWATVGKMDNVIAGLKKVRAEERTARMEEAFGSDPASHISHLLNLGYTYTEIGAAVGHNANTIVRWAKLLNVPETKRPKALIRPLRRQTVEQAIKDGLLLNLPSIERAVVEDRYAKRPAKTFKEIGERKEFFFAKRTIYRSTCTCSFGNDENGFCSFNPIIAIKNIPLYNK